MPRFRRQVQRRSNPNKGWSATVGATRVSIPANTAVLLGSFAAGDTEADVTVLRTVGMFAISSDQVSASEDQIGAFGLIKVTDTALAAGIASIPNPVDEASSDGWFVYRSFAQTFTFITAAGFDPITSTIFEFDSKAKRVVHGEDALAIVVGNAHATHGFDIVFSMRVLQMVRGTH